MATYYVGSMPCSSELYHYGVKGMKWGKHLFGLAEDVGRYVRGTAKQIKGQITGNSATAGIGKAMVSNARRSVGRNVSGLREAASNTAYNARQFLTGSEDRKRMNDNSQMAKRLRDSAAAARKAGNAAQAKKWETEANKYEYAARRAKEEYESMTLPGMTQKAFRNANDTLKKHGIDIEKFYNSARDRIGSGLSKIAGGANKAATWIVTGFSALLKKAKKAIKMKMGTYYSKPQSNTSIMTAANSPSAPSYDPNYVSNKQKARERSLQRWGTAVRTHGQRI